jgi:hypothetical protein
VKKYVWDLCFRDYIWLDRMVLLGFTLVLGGWDLKRPLLNDFTELIWLPESLELALLLVGQTKYMDWETKSGELIQTLRSQEGIDCYSISGLVKLHIGQPFGRVKADISLLRLLKPDDKLQRSLHCPETETRAQTILAHYEPRIHAAKYRVFHSTSAVKTSSRGVFIQDAKQSGVAWEFIWELMCDIQEYRMPLLPGGRTRLAGKEGSDHFFGQHWGRIDHLLTWHEDEEGVSTDEFS